MHQDASWLAVRPDLDAPDGATPLKYAPIPPEVNATAAEVVDAAGRIHWLFGPGLSETFYQRCLASALRKRGLVVQEEYRVAVRYDDVVVENAARMDLLVNGHLVVEIKAVERVARLHEAQLLTYLKVTGVRLGLLINFNSAYFADAVMRKAN